jgi:hypothetical protein
MRKPTQSAKRIKLWFHFKFLRNFTAYMLVIVIISMIFKVDASVAEITYRWMRKVDAYLWKSAKMG